VTSSVGRETTSITATVSAADVETAVAALAELSSASIDGASLEAAKAGALADIAAAQAPATLVMDALHETAFQGTALGKPLRGSAEAIESLTAADLNAVAANFSGAKMALTASGAADAVSVSGLAEKFFSSVADGAAADASTPRYIGSDVRFREDDLGFAQVAVGIETGGWSDPNAVPMMVAQQILGSWDRSHPGGTSTPSLLATGLGEEKLATSFNTFLHFYRGSGLFGVNFAGTDATVQDASYHVMQSLVRLQHIVSEPEVAYGKEKLKAALLAKPLGTATASAQMGEQILAVGRVVSAAELYARADAVDAAAVQAACYEYADSDHVLAAAGQLHELPSYDWFRNRTHWLAY
jgi:predicted Zn-dependent peptidase